VQNYGMRLLLLLGIAACGSSPKRDPVPVPTAAETSEPAETSEAPSEGAGISVEPLTTPSAGTTTEMRCLPLIGCGCFMQCSMGFFEEPQYGQWKVDYYDTMVMAKIEQHCVDGTCAEVFAVHTCQNKCTPAPLNVRCEIERDTLITCKRRP
jgi:hypothetical protein